MPLHAVSWILYIVGIALVAGGYLNLVSPSVSWMGWIIGMAGWGMQFLPAFKKSSLAQELERLETLYREGALSEEEFIAAKARLLS